MHIFIKKKNPTWQGSSDKVFNRDSANSIALVSLSISVHKNNKNIQSKRKINTAINI